MTDWEERDLESDSELPDPGGSWLPSESPSWLPWALWSLIPLSLLGLYFYISRPEPTEAPEAEPALASEAPNRPAPAAEEAPDVEPEVQLPPLAESDPFLRELLSRLSSHPMLAELLVPDDLVRKIVVVTANVAEGASPARHLTYVRPEERMSVIRTPERIVIDAESYRRYDPFTALVASVDAASAAKLFRVLEPLFDEAHAELGLTERKNFEATLSVAIDQLLAAPVVDGPILLEAVSVNYALRDPKLQALNPAQKHLVRMGPENTKRIQAKLAELSTALKQSPRQGTSSR
jgi:hypothetical protein